MTENQRRALQVAEETFRRYSDHHAIKGDETKARANMALAGQMSAALAEPDPDPSCDDKRLAEIVMSDCGHSTNHTRLLERITNRIAAHVATQTAAALAEKRPPLTDQQIARLASGLDGCTGLPVHSSPENWRKVFSFARSVEAATQAQGADLQLTEAEIGNLWHQHMTKLPHEASAAEFIAGVRAGASAVRQKAKPAQEDVPFLEGSEILEIAASSDHTDGMGFARKIEQAVRQKAGLA